MGRSNTYVYQTIKNIKVCSPLLSQNCDMFIYNKILIKTNKKLQYLYYLLYVFEDIKKEKF